ncbi:hypothetical protein ACJOV8_015110 [Formosa sp. 3Alg 14/1]|uniref:hypothetical protein n=1 Tax=Formosa sp. 3Alg 14/1 TaxID=3382190 RepID=UPI0039BE7058
MISTTEEKGLTQRVVMNALDYAYDKTINGLPGFDTAEEMAKGYMNNTESLVENVNSLIRWQI